MPQEDDHILTNDIKKMKNPIPLHLILFSIYLILFIFAYNEEKTISSDMVISTGMILGFTFSHGRFLKHPQVFGFFEGQNCV